MVSTQQCFDILHPHHDLGKRVKMVMTNSERVFIRMIGYDESLATGQHVESKLITDCLTFSLCTVIVDLCDMKGVEDARMLTSRGCTPYKNPLTHNVK